MKRVLFIFAFLLLIGCKAIFAQQDPMFTMYMTNPVTINPAIAGTRGVASLSLISRKQWVGIEGSPTTISLSYQSPFSNDKVGLGANIIHDILGPVKQTGAYFQYSYHLKLDREEKSKLSLGLMGGFNYYVYNLYDLHYNGPDDDISQDGYNNRFLLNFGLGAFYYDPKYFFGLSIPKVLRNSLFEGENTLTIENREERHFFAMAGMIIDLNDNLKLKPSLIARIVNGAPYSADLNATLMLYDKIWFGLTYSLGNSLGGMIRCQLNKRMHIGYSYDMSTSRIKAYNAGSHEVFISFDLGAEKDILGSIRYF